MWLDKVIPPPICLTTFILNRGQAAQLQARYNIRPADALHVATAVSRGATGFITNDKSLHSLQPVLELLVLDDFL